MGYDIKNFTYRKLLTTIFLKIIIVELTIFKIVTSTPIRKFRGWPLKLIHIFINIKIHFAMTCKTKKYFNTNQFSILLKFRSHFLLQRTVWAKSLLFLDISKIIEIVFYEIRNIT